MQLGVLLAQQRGGLLLHVGADGAEDGAHGHGPRTPTPNVLGDRPQLSRVQRRKRPAVELVAAVGQVARPVHHRGVSIGAAYVDPDSQHASAG